MPTQAFSLGRSDSWTPHCTFNGLIYIINLRTGRFVLVSHLHFFSSLKFVGVYHKIIEISLAQFYVLSLREFSHVATQSTASYSTYKLLDSLMASLFST